jgi:hypothetical protein
MKKNMKFKTVKFLLPPSLIGYFKYYENMKAE